MNDQTLCTHCPMREDGPRRARRAEKIVAPIALVGNVVLGLDFTMAVCDECLDEVSNPGERRTFRIRADGSMGAEFTERQLGTAR